MAKIKFTSGRVTRFICDEGKAQSFMWSSDVQGLAVRATASGSKSYIFQTKLNARTIRITIGDVKVWSIDQAEAEARRLQVMVDNGDDPRLVKAEKLAANEAKRAEEFLSGTPAHKIWMIYIDARKARWSKKHYDFHLTASKAGGIKRTRGRRKGEPDETQPGILWELLNLPLCKIDSECVRLWLREEAIARPTYARLGFSLLRAFLNWCADQKEYRSFIHADVCAPRLSRNELPKKVAKTDCLQREQLKLWFEKVRTISNPVISAYLQTALLTGARRGEIAGMRWSDVDFKWKTIRIADKVDGERTIPLTTYVADLLTSLKRINDTPPPRFRILEGRKVENDLENWKPSEWVFSSKSAKSGRLQEPRIQHNKACAAAGIVGLTIHGLRRSFGTLAEWVECPAGVVAQIQGHKPSATAEKHYRVRPIDLLRVWHLKIEAWILEEAGIEQPKTNMTTKPQVVPMPRSDGA